MDLSSTLHVLKNEGDFHTIGVYDNPEFGWNFGTLIEGFKAVICLFSVIVPKTSLIGSSDKVSQNLISQNSPFNELWDKNLGVSKLNVFET